MDDSTHPSLPPRSPRRLLIHLIIFLAAFSLWTWKLLEPDPVPQEVREGLENVGLKFAAAKSLHVIGYFILTILALALPAPRRWHYFLVGLLVWHGVATEIGQTFVPNRTGSTLDVAIDWCGVTLGILAVRWWNRR